jgi:threonyl-tRNA synthetase
MHAACATVEEAREQFELLCVRFAGLMNDIIAPGRWVLGWEGTVDFYEANRDWLIGIGTRIGVPAFFKLMPRMSHYYAIKNEYQCITEDLSNVQVSTVQWDVKDGERFDIGFVDDDGRKHPCPVIIHASSFGSIERTLCAILENTAVDAKQGRPPMFPVWLSPTQARVIPVSEGHIPFAESLCAELTGEGIRADVDDRNETVGKKIRNGEREWVPYLLVVGDKEESSGSLTVRIRAGKSQEEMSRTGLAARIRGETAGMPQRPLPLPVLLSQRPLFTG